MKDTIQDMLRKIKSLNLSVSALPEISEDIFLGAVIVLVAFGSFGLGRLSKIEGSKTPIRIENMQGVVSGISTEGIGVNSGFSPGKGTLPLVGSKNGTKYYYAWCAGAQRISEANRTFFASKEEAEARGYTPASNCKGL